MGKRGPAKQPPLRVVRNGNPSHRPVNEGVQAPLVDELEEPDWSALFPTGSRKPARPKKPTRDELLDEVVRLIYESDLQKWHRQCEAIDGAKRCRVTAEAEWRCIVPILAKVSGLSQIDRAVVIDYCVTVARLQECERQISAQGLIVAGQKGSIRNPLTTVATQYATRLKAYIGELGLSPSARGAMSPVGSGDDDDDPFG